jgi:methionyl aminopeptidase
MARIKIKSKKEIELLRTSGALAAEILRRAGELVRPGVTTEEINTFVHDFTLANGAIPSPLNYHGFPKSVCTSVNEVVTHGIPGPQVLKDGDIINIDVTCKLQGYHGDTSRTYLVGNVATEAMDLVNCAEKSMYAGIEAAGKPGAYFSDIGNAIQGIADEYGFSVVRDYCGHGIGRGFHEDPHVLHFRNNEKSPMIKEGMVFTIEPMINAGDWRTKTLKDGWTAVTIDGKLSAQFEHTLAITANGIEILTQ